MKIKHQIYDQSYGPAESLTVRRFVENYEKKNPCIMAGNWEVSDHKI